MATIRLLCSFAIVAAAGVCILPVLVNGQQSWAGWQTWGQWSQWNPWRPQWEYFDPYVHVETQYGFVKGFTVPWTIEDEVWREWQERPPWYLRRINCFLGIPYAAPPVGQLRFQVEIVFSYVWILLYKTVVILQTYSAYVLLLFVCSDLVTRSGAVRGMRHTFGTPVRSRSTIYISIFRHFLKRMSAKTVSI